MTAQTIGTRTLQGWLDWFSGSQRETGREEFAELVGAAFPAEDKLDYLVVATMLTQKIREHLPNCLRYIAERDCDHMTGIVVYWAKRISKEAPVADETKVGHGFLPPPSNGIGWSDSNCAMWGCSQPRSAHPVESSPAAKRAQAEAGDPAFAHLGLRDSDLAAGIAEEPGEPRTHDLKTWLDPFEALWSGAKTFEIRKDDRRFHVGDTLNLREWNEGAGIYTGRAVRAEVTYKVPGGLWGLPDHLCVLALRIRSEGGGENGGCK